MKFNELEIKGELKRAVDELGYVEMMPIQEKTIPAILNGENIIGEAATGTGKTAAFALPILNNIDFTDKTVQCLIVTPTRELAMQIVNEIKKLGKYLNISYATLVGGMSIGDQVKELRSKPAIIVGTLGRINDHIRSKKLDLSNIKYFILDEADEMLKEGFKEDITIINNCIPKSKQTLLFSATISKQILTLSKDIMDDYKHISVKNEEGNAVNIDQYYLVMKEKNKFSTLTKLLDIDNPASAIIFGRTKRRADELSNALNECGYKAVGLHGDLSQPQRNAVMKKFRENKISILVATDVAARGLDISGVTHVYNFDLPQEVEFYVHRIGRTGRAKNHGVSYSFIKEQELDHIRRIERESNITIKEKSVPSNFEVLEAKGNQIKEDINKKLSEIDTTRTKELTEELIKEYGAEKLVSVLIDSLSNKTSINNVSLTGEPPVVVRNKSARRNESFGRNNRSGNRRDHRDGRNGKRDNFSDRKNPRQDRNKRDHSKNRGTRGK